MSHTENAGRTAGPCPQCGEEMPYLHDVEFMLHDRTWFQANAGRDVLVRRPFPQEHPFICMDGDVRIVVRNLGNGVRTRHALVMSGVRPLADIDDLMREGSVLCLKCNEAIRERNDAGSILAQDKETFLFCRDCAIADDLPPIREEGAS